MTTHAASIHSASCREYVAESVDDIRTIGPENWPSEGRAENFYVTYDWLESQQGWNTPKTKYLVLRDPDSGMVVAALPCYVTTGFEQVRFDNCPRMLLNVDHPRGLAGSLPDVEAERLRAASAEMDKRGALGYPAVVATAANAAMFDYAGRHDPAVMTQLISAFDGLAQELGAPTRAFWYVRPAQFPLLATELAERGYARTLINADCAMDVRWSDLHGYVASLARNRRFGVRREIREFDEAGIRVEVCDADALDDGLCELYANLQRRYGFPADTAAIVRGYAHVAERFRDRMRVFVSRSGTDNLGFVLAMENVDVLYLRQAGFLPANGRNSHFVYFNTVFYAVIRYAIEHGIKRIEFGTESYDAKLPRGCSMHTIESYVRSETVDQETLDNYLSLYTDAAHAYLTAHGARIPES